MNNLHENPLAWPVELWHAIIFKYFNLQDLMNFSRVSKNAAGIAKNDLFWQKEYFRQFPHLAIGSCLEETKSIFEQFAVATQNELKGVKQSRSYKRFLSLFYLAKKGLTSDFGKYLKFYGENDLLSIVDESNKTVIGWLHHYHHQSLLDTLYEYMCKFFIDKTPKTQDHLKTKDSRGWCLFHWAVLCNQSEQELTTLLAKYDVTACAITPLHIAAKFGLSEQVTILISLLRARANFLSEDSSIFLKRWLDMQTSFKKGSSEVPSNQTALHMAAEAGHVKVVNVLLEHDASLSITMCKYPGYKDIFLDGAPDHTGITPLHCAVQEGHCEVSRLLIEKNANIFALDSNAQSPMELAILQDNMEIFKLFEKKLAGDQQIKPELDSILFESVRNVKYEYLESLILLGANPNWKPTRQSNLLPQWSTIDLAIKKKQMKAFKILAKQLPVDQINFEPGPYILLGTILGGVCGLGLSFIAALIIAEFHSHKDKDSTKALTPAEFLFLLFGLTTIGALIGFSLGWLSNRHSQLAAAQFLQSATENNKRDELASETTPLIDLEKGILQVSSNTHKFIEAESHPRDNSIEFFSRSPYKRYHSQSQAIDNTELGLLPKP